MRPPVPFVLILTHAADHYVVERVANALERRGARSLRFDTDCFPLTVRLGARFGAGDEDARIEIAGQAFDVRDFQAVWARKVWSPSLAPDLEPRMREGCVRESTSALYGFLDGFRTARWINRLDASNAAENKLLQLREARAVGLRVPHTLVSNDPALVRAFHDEEGEIVAKMLTPLSVSMDRSAFFVHTSRVRPEDLADLDGLRHSPMVFQEHVKKDVELRVACVGDRLFAGSIDASRSAAGQVDWRLSQPGEVSWTRGELPDDIAVRLRALMARLGLVYGAVDLIRTPDGEHVFLEVNPGGEWGMLERDLDLPISEALADELLAPVKAMP